ncbi:hypothetical protein BJ138DRAFT_1106179 [Hygrophoropsis aurantiaca]|uniref:Uncharacterized protein n=1 Tax=Hygrophoropsis aurantiaca TaxID=72124 RepID=A0ACB7ZWD8_9AGAM|nr:hypothetical protein BJ138DRAFT_1106179 [Hygrophoropsis aurantiaca]
MFRRYSKSYLGSQRRPSKVEVVEERYHSGFETLEGDLSDTQAANDASEVRAEVSKPNSPAAAALEAQMKLARKVPLVLFSFAAYSTVACCAVGTEIERGIRGGGLYAMVNQGPSPALKASELDYCNIQLKYQVLVEMV